MEAITQLLSQYSGADVVLIVLLVAVAIKFISELFDWFHDRLKAHYDEKSEEENTYDNIMTEIRKLNEAMTTLSSEVSDNNASVSEDIKDIKASIENINERLMETIRSSIIDKHHKYVELGQITDFSLQSIERQYEYYKSAGGNSFVDRLMEDIRKIPVVNSDDAIEGDDKNG